MCVVRIVGVVVGVGGGVGVVCLRCVVAGGVDRVLAAATVVPLL